MDEKEKEEFKVFLFPGRWPDGDPIVDSNGERAMTYSFTDGDMIVRPDLVKYVLGKGTYGWFGDNDDEIFEYRLKNNLIGPIIEVTKRWRERQAKKKEQQKEEQAKKRKQGREKRKLEAPRKSERRTRNKSSS